MKTWCCTKCGDFNLYRKRKCSKCKEPKKQYQMRLKTQAKGFPKSVGWVCFKCDTFNAQRKNKCRQCRADKLPWQQTYATRIKYNSPV